MQYSNHIPDSHQIVSMAEVRFGEELGPLDQPQCRGHQGQGVTNLDRNLVQPSVIDAGMQASILLSHKEEACTSRGYRGAN